MAEKEFNEIAVGGGTGTFNGFIDKDLAMDIYFNISPIITGNGGILGNNSELNAKFRLAEPKLTDDFVQLHLPSHNGIDLTNQQIDDKHCL